MKLSEEIMLGSLILAPKRHTFNDGEGHGCAIGMANAAVGFKNPITHAHDGFRNELEIRAFFQRHAWVKDYNVCPVCKEPDVYASSPEHVYLLITHLFDIHEWSPAQIADWVRTIEPQDPAPINTQETSHENTHTLIRIAS